MAGESGKESATHTHPGMPLSARFLLLLSLALGLAGVVLMTELGQVINLPRDLVVGFYYYRTPVSIVILMAALSLVVMHHRQALARRWQGIAYLVVTGGCLFVINWFVPYLWLKAEQYSASYISIEQADSFLEDDADILVLEIDGDARAYPRDSIMLPHIAGDTIGGQNVVMTYCALSNLPQAFSSTVDGQATDYKVIAQVNNNLIFSDRNSGELFQQITGRGEYYQAEPEQFPVQRMNWSGFKQMYPEGKVFHTEPNLLDRISIFLFNQTLGSHYAGDPLFPTIDANDTRLPNSESIWGIDLNGEQLAVARSHFDDGRVANLELGDRSLALAWFPEYETMGAFYRPAGETITGLDPYGFTDDGHQLRRVGTHPGMLWMVWSHWFPDTIVLK